MSKHIKKEDIELKDPILIFINPLSGGGLGKDLIKKCTDVPNLHIVRLPDEVETFHEDHFEAISNPKLRCVACGGDGTINWVMNLLSDLFTSEGAIKPPLAIIPLGTGNDMSNSIGWGSGMSSGSLKYIYDKINDIATSQSIKMVDRWLITFNDKTDPNAEERQHHYVNYFSIGVDAGVTYEYAEMRAAKNPSTRLGAFALYVPAGAHFLTDKTKINQLAKIHLYGEVPEVDEKKKSKKKKHDKKENDKDDDTNTTENDNDNEPDTNENESNENDHHHHHHHNDQHENNNNNETDIYATYLKDPQSFDIYPETLFKAKSNEQTITFLSSRNMYAGRLLWRGKHKADMSDGKLEILINKGATRLAMTNLGFVLPRSYGQARAVHIETTQKIYYQVDGEAFMFPNPADVRIRRDGFYPFILPSKPECRVQMTPSEFRSMRNINYQSYTSEATPNFLTARPATVSHFSSSDLENINNNSNANEQDNDNTNEHDSDNNSDNEHDNDNKNDNDDSDNNN